MQKIDKLRGFENQGFETHDHDAVVNLDPNNTITYSWNNINVFAEEQKRCFDRSNKKESIKKHILRDVSGLVRPGEVVAIMGASGAGKTTLLNVLTGRSSTALEINGDLFVNGSRITPDQLTSKSAYVQQEDLFIGTLTVREMLHFQAMLRMDREIPMKRRIQRIDEVMEELGLLKCAKTLIGIPGRIKGISGGETKRLAFACEVLTDPPMMFCDEPTTGLDSFMAQNIVESMRKLASKNKTIISTIHQPSSEVFSLFDRVLLMAEGRVAFLGLTTDALTFFQGEGYTCPRKFNPADFFISKLAIQPDKEDECRETVSKICDNFRDCSLGITLQQGIHRNMQGGGENEFVIESKNRQTYKASFMAQMKAVVVRSCLEVIREPMTLRVKLIQTIVTSVLLGVIFWGQELDLTGVRNMNGALFLLLTNLTFSGVFGVVNVFCMQLPLFLREHYNGMYRADVYFLSKNISEIPLAILLPLIYAVIIYYMVGLNPDVGRFFTCVGILVLVSNIATSFGYFVSCMASSLEMALALSAPLIIPFMMFGGLFINADSVPVYFIWIQYLSWFYYGNEALCINQWSGVKDLETGVDGDKILSDLGFNKDNLGFDIGLLVVLFFFYRFAGFLLLLRKSHSSR